MTTSAIASVARVCGMADGEGSGVDASADWGSDASDELGEGEAHAATHRAAPTTKRKRRFTSGAYAMAVRVTLRPGSRRPPRLPRAPERSKRQALREHVRQAGDHVQQDGDQDRQPDCADRQSQSPHHVAPFTVLSQR